MKRKIILIMFLLSILITTQVSNIKGEYLIPWSRVAITDFEVPDEVNTGEVFTIDVTIKNNRFLPVKTFVQIDLFDGLLIPIKKNIGEESHTSIRGRTSEILSIDCIIREGEIDWYQEKYNVQAMLYLEFPFFGNGIIQDISTVQGIHVKTRFHEKDKAKIENILAPEEIKKDENEFDVVVNVLNEGSFDANTYVRIDMIERPSAFPEFEKFEILEGMAAVRKELGRSKHYIIEDGADFRFVISCTLRMTEQKKEEFTIEAVLMVNIDGKEYQVDTSTFQEIYHDQPFLQEQNYLLLIGLFIGIIFILLLIILIIRIIYPLYRIKRIKLKDEKRRIDRER